MNDTCPCASLRGNDLHLRIRVQPRAAPEGIAGIVGDRLRLRVGAAPVDGAANARVINLLAKALGVARSSLQITRGETARDKELRIAADGHIALANLRRLLLELEKP